MPSAVKQALRALAFECGCGARRRRRRRRGEALRRRLGRCWKNPTLELGSSPVPRGALWCSLARDAAAVDLTRQKTARSAHKHAPRECYGPKLHT